METAGIHDISAKVTTCYYKDWPLLVGVNPLLKIEESDEDESDSIVIKVYSEKKVELEGNYELYYFGILDPSLKIEPNGVMKFNQYSYGNRSGIFDRKEGICQI